MYSAASQKGELEEVDKHLRILEKELYKPKMIDFLETSVVSRVQKAKILQEAAKQVGTSYCYTFIQALVYIRLTLADSLVRVKYPVVYVIDSLYQS